MVSPGGAKGCVAEPGSPAVAWGKGAQWFYERLPSKQPRKEKPPADTDWLHSPHSSRPRQAGVRSILRSQPSPGQRRGRREAAASLQARPFCSPADISRGMLISMAAVAAGRAAADAPQQLRGRLVRLGQGWELELQRLARGRCEHCPGLLAGGARRGQHSKSTLEGWPSDGFCSLSKQLSSFPGL